MTNKLKGSTMVVRALRLLTLSAAVTASIIALAWPEASEARVQTAISRGMFILSSPLRPSSTFLKKKVSPVMHPLRPQPSENLPSTAVQYPPIRLAMSKPSNQSLQQKILQEASLKLRQKDSLESFSPRSKKTDPAPPVKERSNISEGQFSYYVREGQRSEIKEIASVLMDSFHHGSQPAFDSYIRRYKYNHLQMCFDGIDHCDRGLFVACAVPASSSALEEGEQIIGFCSVDGRAPDPSCKIEFLTPSTLAGTSPRPYLSDLGVCVVHRRQGIGVKLVHACEEWTRKRGYEKLYLKVEKKNFGGIGLYASLGYKKTKLPWAKNAVVDERWDTTVLMEKSLNDTVQNERRRRLWIKNQVWKPLKKRVNQYSSKVNNGPPL